ncbi:formin-J-like [Trichogramma pretiosum]|uniref:formin-J-like n=1 Tax=Trichogramma pretiosum TaxID=7493 RepID=UPI0006C959A4|nr:formin-J-like [Trichogramma pretiosum]
MASTAAARFISEPNAGLYRSASFSVQRRQPQQSHHHPQHHRHHNNNSNNGAASVVVDRVNDRCPQQRQRRAVADSNGYKYGSECDCCPYGYHIDVDFVRFCEDWQNAACDRLAEEKRRRRAKQKQRQSMEFMLGLPDEADASSTDADTSPPPSSEMRAVATSTPVERPSQAAAAAAALPKTRQAPESTTAQSHKDWEDTLSNFEQTLSQSFSGPSRSSSMTSIASRCHSSLEPSIMATDYQQQQPYYQTNRSGTCSPRPAVPARPPPPSSLDYPLSTRLILSQARQQQQQQQQQPSKQECSYEADKNNAATKQSLQHVREQMAAALERMRQLEEQVKQVPQLNAQIDLLREERSLLLDQLACLKRAEARSATNRRDAATGCAVATRDVAVDATRQVESRDNWTSPQPVWLTSSTTQTTNLSVSKSTQSEASSSAGPTTCASVGTQHRNARGRLESEKSQCHDRSTQSRRLETVDKATANPKIPDKELGEVMFRGMHAKRNNKEVQATESPSWRKIKLNRGVSAKPDSNSVSTETCDASLSLVQLRRQELISASSSSLGEKDGAPTSHKSVATSIGPNELRSRQVTRSTETPAKRHRDAATSPSQSVKLIDASVGTTSSASSTNYCDECKQASQSRMNRPVPANDLDKSLASMTRQQQQQQQQQQQKQQRTRIAVAKSRVGLHQVVSKQRAASAERAKKQPQHPAPLQRTKSDARPRTRIPVPNDPRSKSNLIRQNTWTQSLDKLEGSDLLDRHYADRHTSSRPQTPAKPKSLQQSPARKVTATPPTQQVLSRPSKAPPPAPEPKSQPPLTQSSTAQAAEAAAAAASRSVENEEIEEMPISQLSEEMVRSVALDSTPDRTIGGPCLSREITAALDLLDKEGLNKQTSACSNAANVVQHEWFKATSVAGAEARLVERWLDRLEHHDSLLGHVVNLRDSSGNTALHYAVSHGNFDVVSVLLDSKVCDVDRANGAGYTPAMLAALARLRSPAHAAVVERLFRMADVNVRARLHGQTALMLAVSHGRKDTTALLLSAGAAVNLQDEDGSTALMCAAEHGHAEIVRLLLTQPDCDASVTDVDGSSALRIALEAGHADVGVLLYAHQRQKAQLLAGVGGGSQSSLIQAARGIRPISASAPNSPVPRRLRSASLTETPAAVVQTPQAKLSSSLI